MNRFRIPSSILAFGVLAASANAQEIDLNVSGGWVLNSFFDENSTTMVSNSGGTNCQSNDAVSAILDWDIRRLTGPDEGFRVIDSAQYSGQLHQGCVLGAVSASDSRKGQAVFTNESGGSISFDIFSDVGRFGSPDPHPSGQVSATCTVTLKGVLVTPPPGVKPPYTKVMSNSASVSGTGAPVFTEPAILPVHGATLFKNYFSVTAVADLSSSLLVPPPDQSPVTPFDGVWAQPAGNSVINLF